MPQAKASRNGAKKLLSLDEIRAVRDLGEETVEVPEWGGSVKVRGLGHGEVIEVFRSLQFEVGDDGNLAVPAARAAEYQIALIQAGSVEPTFDEETVKVLHGKSAVAVGRIADRISELSGLGQGAAEDAQVKGFPAR